MNKKFISVFVSVMLMLPQICVVAEDDTAERFSYSWDLTSLVTSCYNVDSYTAVDNMMEIKAEPEHIAADGVRMSKNNGVRIKIKPLSDGEITVTLTGKAVMPDYENRKGDEALIERGMAVPVSAGSVYYLQGSASSAAAVTAIIYTSDKPVNIESPDPETSEPVKSEEPSETADPEASETDGPEAAKPTAEPGIEYDRSWDLTGLDGDNFNAEEYISIDGSVSVRAASEYVTADGIKVSKNNGVRIRICPETDGQLMIECTGNVVMPDHENRNGDEEMVSANMLIDVYGGVEYYIQGSASSAASIKAVHFVENEFELFAVTGIGFSSDYTKVLEFDIEKGDDYEHDITACLCVYGPDNVLKTVRIKHILPGSLHVGKNTVKCELDIAGYDRENDTLKILLLTGLG